MDKQFANLPKEGGGCGRFWNVKAAAFISSMVFLWYDEIHRYEQCEKMAEKPTQPPKTASLRQNSFFLLFLAELDILIYFYFIFLV